MDLTFPDITLGIWLKDPNPPGEEGYTGINDSRSIPFGQIAGVGCIIADDQLLAVRIVLDHS